MTTATIPPIRPTTAIALWWLIPQPTRRLLRAIVPLDAHDQYGTESLIVAVGPRCPVRWLQVNATDSGELETRLWEVRRTGIKGVAGEVVHANELNRLLERWVKEFGLNQ